MFICTLISALHFAHKFLLDDETTLLLFLLYHVLVPRTMASAVGFVSSKRWQLPHRFS
jgi:hypothetical protein